MATILITGGTGFIGKQLHKLLLSKGYLVKVLSRTKSSNSNAFYWNISENYLDDEAILNTDYIIHLAGANIADKRWTKKRKKILTESRVQSTKLLLKKVKQLNPNLKGFIAASGVGYYGAVTSNLIFTEKDNSGTDFLAMVCKFWEKESLKFQNLNIRTVLFRTGIVFSKEEGAFQKIVNPIKKGFGAVLGNGQQYMPWIYINDLCNMYLEAIENENFNGIYNAVAPEHITNKKLTHKIAKVLNKKIWLPSIPKFVINLLFGKMAIILLEGTRVSSEKIQQNGFHFQIPSLHKLLKKLMN